ncbi:MAG: Gfo/Idh/MocA family oxidoreductase [Candidatus Aenigmarchaeota archaeon]|nr:Gfo/Idh/MocA family oxidoreductase [Candidatus Aenigmarchaeota archaeon]
MYNLGTIGLGHWVKRLHHVIQQRDDLSLVKTVGTRAFDDKREELEQYGISRDMYFQINPNDSIPNEFFDDTDIVHIASPNQFHKSQTIQSLENGKVTVTEKTFGVNREEFNDVINVIKRKNSKANVHLHYLSKALTKEFAKKLPSLIKEHGKITKITASFLEKKNEEDARRKWLFKPENGGVFMDWIHPLTIISDVMKADKFDLVSAKTFVLQPDYDMVNPTAVESEYKVKGNNFSDGNSLLIRVGKGSEFEHKAMRIYFENAFVDLKYLNTEEEFLTGKRGDMIITENSKIIERISPAGPLSYEFMIQEMIKMVNGNNPALTVDDIIKMYEPEWQFQEFSKDTRPTKDKNEIQKFIRDALAH